jgi:predicted nuclease with RNAse H fold
MGVDAPLWYSSGRSSDRLADQWIRKTYGLPSGQVQAANSLRGAALVQAAMFIERLRERFPGTPATESHPKAVLKALRLDETGFRCRYAITGYQGTEHERDAIIAAVAAREGFSGRWRRDLSAERHLSEQNPMRYHLAPIHYWWPDR